MSLFSVAVKAFFCISLLLSPNLSFACKPKFNRISDYIQNRIPYHVIFLGAVLSVKHGQINEGVSTQEIEFSAARWFDGKTQKTVVVKGIIGSYRGTDCEGMADFSAKVGEEWLIFGQLIEGKVYPDNHLSIKLVDGSLPAAFLEQLKQQGLNF